MKQTIINILTPIYGGSYMVDSFNYRLSNAGDNVKIVISSEGGNVFTALGMVGLMRQKINAGAKIETLVVGLVASSATFPLFAGTKVTMDQDAMIMIHKPTGSASGLTSDKLRKQADLVDKTQDTIVNMYTRRVLSKRKDADAKKVRAAMTELVENTSFITAQEALELYLIDEVVKVDDVQKQKVQDQLNLNKQQQSVVENYVTDINNQYKNYLSMDKKTNPKEGENKSALMGLFMKVGNVLFGGGTKEDTKQEENNAAIENAKKLLKDSGFDVTNTGGNAQQDNELAKQKAQLAEYQAKIQQLENKINGAGPITEPNNGGGQDQSKLEGLPQGITNDYLTTLDNMLTDDERNALSQFVKK